MHEEPSRRFGPGSLQAFVISGKGAAGGAQTSTLSPKPKMLNRAVHLVARFEDFTNKQSGLQPTHL